MKALQISRAGGPEVLDLVDQPIPEPGPGQLRIRHQAIGLNFIDTYQRSGLYPVRTPLVLGQEAAGVVDAVGEDAGPFVVGDRVAYCSVLGAYADYNLVPAARTLRLPAAISAETAAAGLLKGLTAEFLLRRCHVVKAGEPVLVHAAAGGVGAVLSQWAKAIGAVVIGAVGSEEKAAIARAQGCDHVILYRDEDVAARVMEITGGAGVDVAYDGVGAATLDASLASLGRRGLLVSFGNASGPAPPVEPARLMRGGSLYLTRPSLADYIATADELHAAAESLFHVIQSGTVKIAIGQRFPLADGRLAHQAIEARQTTGSTLLIP